MDSIVNNGIHYHNLLNKFKYRLYLFSLTKINQYYIRITQTARGRGPIRESMPRRQFCIDKTTFFVPREYVCVRVLLMLRYIRQRWKNAAHFFPSRATILTYTSADAREPRVIDCFFSSLSKRFPATLVLEA